MGNVVNFTPNQETFENFIENNSKKILHTLGLDPNSKDEIILVAKILTDVFDEGVGFGYTMMAEDVADKLEEFFEEVGV